MRVKVTKKFSFDSAHKLELRDWSKEENEKIFHDCSRIHGHSYLGEVTVEGQPGTRGFVIDFKHLKSFIQEFIKDKFDHRMINDVLPEKWHPTTVENILQYLWIDSGLGNAINKASEGDAWLSSIKMWETPDSFGEVSDDRWRNYNDS